MTFVAPRKSQDLRVIVEAAFGYSISNPPAAWQWTDITRYVRGPVSFSAGTQSGAGSADPSQISLTLVNTDGRFTALNPGSPYWPNVVRNVPLRVSITWAGAAGTYELLTAFVNGWPLQPNAGLIDVTVPITATGRLRRLERNSKQVLSAMTRSIRTTSPLAWWPLEDGNQSTLVASGLPTGQPMNPRGTVNFASGDGAPGTGPLADLSTGGQLSGNIPTSGATSYRIEFVAKFPTIAPGDFVAIMQWFTPGSGIQLWEIDAANAAGGGLYVQWLGNDGVTADLYASNVPVDDGAWHHIRINVAQSGGSQTITVKLDNVTVITHTAAKSYGIATGVLVNPTGAPNEEVPRFGQLAVWAPWSGSVDTYAAFTGYAGELASDRVTRLCAENGVPVTVTTGTVASQAMGAQSVDTLANLLSSCADIDNGLLHDAGPSGNLVYVSGPARYNAATQMTLGYTQHQIGDGLASTYDDQDLATDWRISRVNGSNATYVDPTATDDYAQQGTVNAASDRQLSNIASWRTHVGTVDAYRVPSIQVDIRNRSPELAQAVTSLALPARISPTGLPTPFPPDSLDQFAEGFSGTVDTVLWQMTFNCQPFAPWRIFVLDDATLGRIDTRSALTGPVTAAGTSLTVVSDSPWTTAGGDMPFDINLAGEQCTVTAVGASATPMSRVGAFISTSALGASDFSTAYTNWQSITGITLPVVRWYQAQGDFGIGATNLAQMVSAGIKVCLTLRPDYNPVNPAHLVAIDAMLSTLKASGANINVTLWHEPFFDGLTAAQFVAVVKYYGPTVRKYYPLWCVFSGADADVTNGFYPGDAWCDGIAVDAYAASGTTQVTNAQSIADAGGKPFAVWEFNGGADLGSPVPVQGQTQAAVTAHFQYLQDLFTARLAAGKANGDLLLFSSGGSNGSVNFLGTSLSANGGFEGGLGNWVGAGGCTIAQTAAQHHSGAGALALTATGVANMLASHTAVALANLTANALPVSPGDIVMVSAWYKAATVGRSCQTGIFWYDSSAVQLSTSFPVAVADVTTGWTNVIHNATAPASAAFAVLRAQVVAPAGAGEVHYLDDPQIAKLPAVNDLTSPIQYPWDYRIAAFSAMKTALDSTSFPQVMTVTRHVNGITKAHNAGDTVGLWQPTVLGL